MRKLGINWGKSNTYGGVTKQCYVTHLYREPFYLNINGTQLYTLMYQSKTDIVLSITR